MLFLRGGILDLVDHAQLRGRAGYQLVLIPRNATDMPLPHHLTMLGARLRGPLSSALAGADLCHIHGIWNVPEWWASHLARGRHVPYVISPRGMLQPAAMRRGRFRKAVAYRLLESRNLRRASMLHATSDQEADALRALALDVPIAVVPNGVDLAAADAARRGYRARLGIPADAFVVLFLGRLHLISGRKCANENAFRIGDLRLGSSLHHRSRPAGGNVLQLLPQHGGIHT